MLFGLLSIVQVKVSTVRHVFHYKHSAGCVDVNEFTVASIYTAYCSSFVTVHAHLYVWVFLPRACNPYETTDTLGGVLRPVPFDLCDLRPCKFTTWKLRQIGWLFVAVTVKQHLSLEIFMFYFLSLHVLEPAQGISVALLIYSKLCFPRVTSTYTFLMLKVIVKIFRFKNRWKKKIVRHKKHLNENSLYTQENCIWKNLKRAVSPRERTYVDSCFTWYGSTATTMILSRVHAECRW